MADKGLSQRQSGRKWGVKMEKCRAIGCDATKKMVVKDVPLCNKHGKIYKEDPTAIDLKES